MGKRAILIAEDDPDDQMIILDAMKELLFPEPVDCFDNGQSLVDYLFNITAISLQERFPGLLLLDIRMPRKNGFEVLSCLKQHEVWKWLPAVVLSTSNQERDRRLAFQLGADGYFMKPSSFHEMQEILKVIHGYWLDIGLPPLYPPPFNDFQYYSLKRS
jgi:two-component system response regulator